MPEVDPPYVWVILRQMGTWADECDGFDRDNAVDMLSILGFYLPIASYLFAGLLLHFVGTILTYGLVATLFLNEVVMFLLALAFPKISSSQPDCPLYGADKPYHGASVATCVFVYCMIYKLRFHRFRTVRERGDSTSLVIYYTLSLWAPVHMPTFTTEQMLEGVGIGLLSVLTSLTLLYRYIINRREDQRVRRLLGWLSVQHSNDFDTTYYAKKDEWQLAATEPPHAPAPVQAEDRPQLSAYRPYVGTARGVRSY